MESVLVHALKEGTISNIVIVLILGYLIVIRFLESKEKSKQGKLTSEVADAIVKMQNLLTIVTEDIILSDKDKCRASIDASLNAMGKHLLIYAVQTIVHNNIHLNNKVIHDNVKRIVTAEFYKVHMNIGMYTIEGIKPTKYLKEEWKSELVETILECIYLENASKEYKILNLSNTLNVKVNEYSIYINNKVFGI